MRNGQTAQPQESWWLRGRQLTLPIFPHLLEKRKLLRIIHHHELLQEPLDHLAHRGRTADVELLDGVQRQVEGRSLVRHLGQVHLLEGIVDGLRPDPRRHRHGAAQLQMHFNETRVRPIVILKQRRRGNQALERFSSPSTPMRDLLVYRATACG